jgi:cytochrome c-type biogenesis protein CcmH
MNLRSAIVLLSGLTVVAPVPAELSASAPASFPTAQTPPPTQTVIPDPDVFEAAAPTDDPELEAKVRKLARQLRCPTCQALSIADSPSELAREMEGVIRLRLQEGMSPEEVRKSFVDSYGEWVLLSPDPAGFNLLVYVLPFAVVLAGGAIVVVAMRRWLAASPPEDESPSPS